MSDGITDSSREWEVIKSVPDDVSHQDIERKQADMEGKAKPGAFKLHGGKMKARILETGALQVKRAGVWVTQFCPYRGKFCGDHCPKFDESAPLCDVEACGVPLKVESDDRSRRSGEC